MKRSLVAVLSLFFCLAGFGQEFRATISGVVSDPSGAGVPNAKIVATETRTGTKSHTVSDSSGNYTIPFLLPGDYQVVAESPGFKQYVRSGITLASSDHPVIDIHLTVGEASQTVEVTAAAPLINADNATVGQAITTKQVEDLPLNGRTPLVLASLSVGVVATGQPSLIHPFDSGGAAGWSIGGAPSQTNEILLDGSPDATWDGRLAYSPPADAVQEVRVKAFDADAAFGHTNGGTLNQILKSGTNTLHGSLWEFNEPNTLTANDFFNNAKGLGTPVTHYNQYGLTAGGPMIIPKIFNGKNKLFWFFAWEGLKDSQPNTAFLSVPTEAERQGNFAGLPQLYDPYTGILNATTKVITRSPYQNNQIPAGEINPIAQAYLKLIPLPNIPSANGYDNYGNTAPTTDDYNNYIGRLDYNASDKDRMFFDVRTTDYLQSKNNYFGNLTTGSNLIRNNLGLTYDNVYTLNPTNVLDLRLNFTRMNEAHPSPSTGFDPASLGFPSYVNANSQLLQLPAMSFSKNTGDTQLVLGQTSANILPSQSAQIFFTWVMVKGSHTLKYGVDLRQYNLNVASFGNSAGGYSFTNNNWVRSASNASSTVVQGQDFAEFLLGLPTSGQYDINTSGAFYEHYYAGFVQDDWRITHSITLNLGARFDYDAPWAEKYGRTVNGFDTTTPNPLAAAAIAAYNKNPIPQIPVGSFQVPGGLTFPTNGGSLYTQNSHMLSPRIGIAWSPDRFHQKTVLRGGFAIFVQPVDITQLAINGKYSTNPILNQQGFSQTTTFVPTNDNYVTPATTLSNPFPTGIQQPVGTAAGLATFAGQSIGFMDPQQKDPYSVRWNFGIQQQLSNNMMFEVDYMGSHGVHLPIYVTSVDPLPANYLSTLPIRDQTLVNTLTATVPNPFKGLNTSQNGSTVSVAQLLSPFPEFPQGNVLMYNNPIGSSYYEALDFRIEKRFSSGLSLIGNYVRSKLIERDTFLNPTDTVPEKRISPFDFPNRVVIAAIYELPFGKGRRFNINSRWVDALLGGWGLNNIYTYQTGGPILWVNGSTTNPGDYVYFGGPLNVNPRQTNGPAFNTSVFDTASADQLQYHLRTFSTTFPNARTDGINEWETSITKRFNINEHMYFQLRGEAYNVLNHPSFGSESQNQGPNTVVTNAAFGTITTQSNRPRTLQLGLRFVF